MVMEAMERAKNPDCLREEATAETPVRVPKKRLLVGDYKARGWYRMGKTNSYRNRRTGAIAKDTDARNRMDYEAGLIHYIIPGFQGRILNEPCPSVGATE